MKISWNWLREILPTQIDVNKAAEILTDIGLEVEAVYPYESIKGGLEGLIVGEVITCERHPDADKLKTTKVNIGKGELLNIVCGAPNVAVGQKVIVASISTTIHPVKGEPFTIKKATIRGVESEGMLCAEDEIGLGEGHAGLFILNADAVVGSDVKKYFDVYSDIIIEIGLTANHADANSHYGVARELFAALNAREIEKAIIKENIPDKGISPQGEIKRGGIQVLVEDKINCPRYSGLVIKNIKIKESPAELQNKLKAIGLRPINNVVDITNYILHELGQPLHAFDADKIAGNKIIIKTLPENTAFITLDEKERKLSANDLMICDAEKGMCIAGVYGGIHSGINDATKNIFLESAYFNPVSIRKTENRHGLKTDASSRFGKGTDPEITVTALWKAAKMITEICGGEIASDVIDIYPEKIKPFSVFLRYARLEMMAAIKIEEKKIIEILELLNIKILEKKSEGLQLEIPSYKNDVLREIDVIEEILRMYGYNNIPVLQNIRTPYIVSPKPDKEKIKLDTIHYLASNGFYEIFTNSISRSKYITQFLPAFENTQVKLLNSLNAELDCMRQSMLFTGLEVIAFTQNRKQTDLKLFEFGRVYFQNNNSYTETDKVAFYITGNKFEENWRNKNRKVDLFDIKEEVENLLNRMNVEQSAINSGQSAFGSKQFEFIEAGLNALNNGVEIISDNKLIGMYGLVKKEICSAFDIKQEVYYAELNWNDLIDVSAKRKTVFKEISKYPEVRRDLAMLLDPSVQYSAVETIAKKEGKNILQGVTLFDIYEGEKLEGKKSYAIGLTFRDDEKTLTDKEVDDVMQKMMSRYEKELNAVIRKN
ncbi:MAG: phenylalanine--tRNA ligase subunit beta [Fimbriimonadaceae bacterium]|nr:phenylalanine--tRNA ligase subunit beta [Chitinophagales bacterium]